MLVYFNFHTVIYSTYEHWWVCPIPHKCVLDTIVGGEGKYILTIEIVEFGRYVSTQLCNQLGYELKGALENSEEGEI